MADFGDEMGEFIARELIQEFKSGSKAILRGTQNLNGELIDKWDERIDKWIERNKKRKEELRKARENGKSGQFDLTDGRPQYFEYDLPEGLTSEEKAHIKDEILKPILEEKGLAHPQTYFLGHDEKGNLVEVEDSNTIGFLFEDDGGDPERTQEAIEEADLEIHSYEPVMKLEKTEQTFARARGFGLLDQQQRREFTEGVKASLQRAGVDPNAVNVPTKDAVSGELGSDLTVDIHDGKTRAAAIAALREECRKWTDVLAQSEHPMPITIEPSTHAADELGPDSFEAVSGFFVEFKKALEAEGFEPRVVFDPDGIANITFPEPEAVEGDIHIQVPKWIEQSRLIGELKSKANITAIPQPSLSENTAEYCIPRAQAESAWQTLRELRGKWAQSHGGGEMILNFDQVKNEFTEAFKALDAKANVPSEADLERIRNKALSTYNMKHESSFVSKKAQKELRDRALSQGRVLAPFAQLQEHAEKAALDMKRAGLTLIADRTKLPTHSGWEETDMPRFFRKSK